MSKKRSEEKVREDRRRERGFGFAVKRTSVGHHSLIQTPSARVGSPRANFLYPIFYIQFSIIPIDNFGPGLWSVTSQKFESYGGAPPG